MDTKWTKCIRSASTFWPHGLCKREALIGSSHQTERPRRRGKRTVTRWTSSCARVWRFWMLLLKTSLIVARFPASYSVRPVTCSAWTGGSGTIVPPYLTEQLAGTSAHRHILIQAVNAALCWLGSHARHHLGRYCARFIFFFFSSKRVFAVWDENNAHFPLRIGNDWTAPLWNDDSQRRRVRWFRHDSQGSEQRSHAGVSVVRRF